MVAVSVTISRKSVRKLLLAYTQKHHYIVSINALGLHQNSSLLSVITLEHLKTTVRNTFSNTKRAF